MRPPLLLPLLLAACAATQTPPPHAPGACDASGAQAWIGQPATSELAAAARDRAGAAIVRWLTPGMITTREYRADRLNIELDGRNLVIAIRCG